MSLSPPQLFAVVCAFVFGITIGSFLNVVIWRLPRGGNVSVPTWSYCPRCEHRLGALELVPVFSFLALGRRCLHCHEPISWRYPAIELLTGVLFTVVAWKFGLTFDTIFYCLFAAVLVCVFFIDLEHFIIPDGLNVTAILIGFAHNGVDIATGRSGQFVDVGKCHIPASLFGLVVYAVCLYTIGLLAYVWFAVIDGRKNVFIAARDYIRDNVMDWVAIALYYAGTVIPPLRRFVEPPEPLEGYTADEIESDDDAGGMGGGDGKLAAAIGANLYVVLALQSFFWAIFLTLIGSVGVLVRQRRRLGDKTAVPFGPGMAVGAFAALVLQDNIAALWNLYISAATNAGH